MTKDEFSALSAALPLLDPYPMRIALLHLFRGYMDMHHPNEAIFPLQCSVTMEHGVNVMFSSNKPNVYLSKFLEDVPFLQTLRRSSSPYFFSLSSNPEQIQAMRQAAQSCNIAVGEHVLFPRWSSIEQSYTELLSGIDRCDTIPALLRAYQSRAYVDYLLQRDFGWGTPIEWSSEQHAIAAKMHDSVQWLKHDAMTLIPHYKKPGSTVPKMSILGVDRGLDIPHAFASDICTWMQGISRNAKEYKATQNYNNVRVYDLNFPVSKAVQSQIDHWYVMFEDRRSAAMIAYLRAETPRRDEALEVAIL